MLLSIIVQQANKTVGLRIRDRFDYVKATVYAVALRTFNKVNAFTEIQVQVYSALSATIYSRKQYEQKCDIVYNV